MSRTDNRYCAGEWRVAEEHGQVVRKRSVQSENKMVLVIFHDDSFDLLQARDGGRI